MKAKQSKRKSEMVLGKYFDYPYEQQKKVNKQLIKRTRRVLEKRESTNEINEAIYQMQ